jgi:uncharacterized membrane protein
MTEFSHPPDWRWISGLAAVVVLVVGLSYTFARGRGGPIPRILGAILRLGAIAVLGVCLLDPHRVQKILHPHKARLAVLFDVSRSMATGDTPGGRLSAARDWTAKHVTRGLPEGVEIIPLTFSDTLRRPTNNTPLSATGSISAISGALASVLATPSDEPLSGVLLLSDGIETTSQLPDAIARQFRRKGIPIHTVAVGTTNEMRDVIIEQVQVRRSAANDAPTKVVLEVRSPGFKGSNLVLQIRRGKDTLATRGIRLNGSNQPVELEFTPRGTGFQVFDVVASPTPGEWLAANNQRKFGLEIIDPSLRVLYMEGTPQNASSPIPEWKYLKDALQSDKRIKVSVLYRQFGNNGQYLNTVDADPQTGERAWPVEHPTQGFPKSLAKLLDYDVVIHSDIRRESFSDQQLDAIAGLVEKHGGGFVMIGGNSAFGRGGYHKTVLDRIIPLAMEGAYDNEATPTQLRIAPNAWAHPLVNIGNTTADTRRIWTERFPTLYGYNRVERAKPGATVLGTGDDGVILLAVQEVGRGRTMAFTSDTTRSWGRDFETLWGEPIRRDRGFDEDNCDSRYYRSFWINAVRWLAAGKSGRTNQPVVLELSQGYGSPGDSVTATVRVRDNAEREISNAEVALFLSTGGLSNVVANARYDAASRAYRATIPMPTAGTHILSAVATTRSNRIGDDRQLLVSEVIDRELADLRARPDLMASIARASGGTAFNIATNPPANLGATLAQLPPPTEELRRTSLWDKLPWLLTALGLISGEWLLRRWRGLA